MWLFFFNFDKTTQLRHMWSGPPMSPSPMSACGATGQTWGLSSSKPSRWSEVSGSCLQVGLDVILRPGPFIDAERDFGGLPYWLLKWVSQGILASLAHPERAKENWGPVTQSFLLEWGLGTPHCFQGWSLIPVSNFMLNFSRLQGLFFHQGGPIIMVQVV